MSTRPWLVALSLAIAIPACAQDSFGKLPKRVHTGQTVVVIDVFGTEVEGQVSEVSSTKLVLDGRTFAPEEVRRVFKPNRLWDGAVTGAAVGAVPVMLMTVAEACVDCHALNKDVVQAGLIGAGIGLGLDALLGPRTLFRNRHARARHVSLAPVVGRERKSVAAAISF